MPRPRVLVIDDEILVRSMVLDILDEAGFDVIEAANGREGLDLFAGNPTDVVITDILMPEMEGLETIAALRKLSPDVKIIAISGGGSAKYMEFLKISESLGAMRTLAKPLDADHLVQEVNTLLQTAVSH
ncbi:MAG: response regulator [Rhodospirillales bacterium]|nr:response regulator [Rhodospirillales bacterium]